MRLALVFLLTVFTCHAGDLDVRIGGHVRREDGTPLEHVQIRITWPEDPGAERLQLTDAGGAWTWGWDDPWGRIPGWRHVVVEPSLAGYAFSPARYELTVQGSRLDLDFTAAPTAPARRFVILWTGDATREAWNRLDVTLRAPGAR